MSNGNGEAEKPEPPTPEEIAAASGKIAAARKAKFEDNPEEFFHMSEIILGTALCPDGKVRTVCGMMNPGLLELSYGRLTIDFIKIDTQGHETSVLEGARKILGKSTSVKMLIELFPAGLAENRKTATDLISLIRELGFVIRWPKREVINSCTVENGRHCNLYAVKGKTK